MRQLKITQAITNRRESESLEKYFTEVSREDMVTAEEEVELAQRIREGDQVALNRLVKANLRFVVSVAKQYQNKSMSLNDLINEGNLGLVKAAQRFDETKGFKFISYAVWWIRQSIMQAIAENSRIVRLPVNKTSSINKIRTAFSSLEQKFEREPTAEELSEILEMQPEEIRNTMGVEVRQTSVDAPLNSEDSNSLLDVMVNKDIPATDEHLEYHNSLQVETSRVLSTLSFRERVIVKMSFGIGEEHPRSLEDIGEELNLTRERVRQIREKAIKKLKGTRSKDILKAYVA
ncbi:sigma-70 family RNA polymerase sigma factor [Flexithrix dorotheae]|uniref:sigma-70 family RNA polymerase sigma factor n=1 Tax=Flexithrix dorotheae TaxID=70993 RepID=UPI0003640371|nr:RNA polymerase sigma factor RpoD/SigA [Flexithrix dorotheae]